MAKSTTEADCPPIFQVAPPDLPDGLKARLWIEPCGFFSPNREQSNCWLWLLRGDGRVQAARLPDTTRGRDDRLASLLARLDACLQPHTLPEDFDDPDLIRPLSSAPVVPVLRWALSWGHPLQQAIRDFAGLLDQEVMNALGQLEVPGPFFGSTTNYNRLACLPDKIRRHRLQALRLFPPLVAPLLLESYERPDMFNDRDYSRTIRARFAPADEAPVLGAMDHGRDLTGALAAYWRIDRSLVRTPLMRSPWRKNRIGEPLLHLLNAIPAHRRPRNREAIEPWLWNWEELPTHPDTKQDFVRLAGIFVPNWEQAWRRLHDDFPPLTNRLRDCRDFLRSALLQVDWVDLPRWLDTDTLALGWMARRGAASLLAASQRWHEQPATTRSLTMDLPRALQPLLGQIKTDTGTATELTSADALHAEGESMHHCVGDYWSDCLFRPIRVVHLELADGSAGTAQYNCDRNLPDPRFHRVELRGPCNEDCPDEMEAFAEHIAGHINDPALRRTRIEILREATELREHHDWESSRQTMRLLDRRSRRELRLVIDYCLKQPDWREQDDIVYRGNIAGFGHAGALALKNDMHAGDPLELAREPDNPHDPQAVRIDWQGTKIGYIPRNDNTAIAQLLDTGQPLQAVIHLVRQDGAIHPVDCVVRVPPNPGQDTGSLHSVKP